MSRSYKHSPCYVIGCKKDKRIANKRVRHYLGEIGQGCFYKRLYESYNIRDWVFYSPEERRNNEEFRRIARIVRNILKGKLRATDYNLIDFIEKLSDYKDSFDYVTK